MPKRVASNAILTGIEIEIENARLLRDKFGVWSTREDGSLRNGIEYVSVPLRGNEVSWALDHLFAALGKSNHFSPRTSVHIHLNVQPLKPEQLIAIILTYLAIEPLLYRFVGHDREKSQFCVPLYQTTILNDFLEFWNSHISVGRFNWGNSRYAGLNLDAIRKFGTIEFRQLNGTNDVNKILNWINLLYCIYDFSVRKHYKELLYQIGDLNTNSFYIAFINEVFGGYSYLLDTVNIKGDLEKGVKAVKQSMMSNKFYQELCETISLEESPAGKVMIKRQRISPPTFDELAHILEGYRGAPQGGVARRVRR
jgi:hypothetical protein